MLTPAAEFIRRLDEWDLGRAGSREHVPVTLDLPPEWVSRAARIATMRGSSVKGAFVNLLAPFLSDDSFLEDLALDAEAGR